MMNRTWKSLAALAAALTVVCSLLAQPQAQAQAQPQAQPQDQAQVQDMGWPRDIPCYAGTITIYQPQPESLKANVLTGRAASSFLKTGETEPVFGVVWFQGTLDVDRDARTALLRDVTITRVRFPNASPDAETSYIRIVEAEIPKWQQPLSLDRLLASLAVAEQEEKWEEGLKNDPPKIVVADYPTVMVLYDGEPVLRDIPDTKLQRVANTAFPVIYDPSVKTYYLTNTTYWYGAPDPMGPWTQGAKPTAEVQAAIPKEAKDDAAQDRSAASDKRPPNILAAKEPTEVVWTDGKPDMADLGTGQLLYVKNTKSNVFLEVATQQYFVLLSGRWYTSKSLQGPWSFLKPTDLPKCFETIPPISSKGPVRASVPGTEESMDAVMDTQIPQTAAIKRGVAEDVKVNYDGEPQFKPVEKTELQYAANTGQQVIKVKDQYFLCQEGVWYVSSGPNGPWTVSDKRPEGVDDIPPSSPMYNTKYVYVYNSTPDVVYAGYTPGYNWAYPYYGTVVYGTGYYYPGWCGAYYYPWAWTYGWGAYYSPWYGWGYGGGFGWGFAWGFAWGAAWSHWGYGCGYWGGGGYYHGNINVGNINIGNGNRPGGGQGNRPGGGQGNRPGAGQGNRPSTLPSNNRYNRGDNAGRNATPEQRAKATQDMRNNPRVSQGKANNVYAGRDGNVYRKTADGWQQRGQGGQWNKANFSSGGAVDRGAGAQRPSAGTMDRGAGAQRPSAGTMDRGAGAQRPSAGTMDRGGMSGAGNLNRDAAARQRGASQTRSYNNYRGSGGMSRGGGGMSRGGGGRRR